VNCLYHITNLNDPICLQSANKLTAFKDLRDGSIGVAAILQCMLKDEVSLSIKDEEPPCVALLCQSNVDFLFVLLGLIRAGYSVLLIAYV